MYAHKKYHSGLIWIGVERGFALIKFSGSKNAYGKRKTTVDKIRQAAIIPTKSFTV